MSLCLLTGSTVLPDVYIYGHHSVFHGIFTPMTWQLDVLVSVSQVTEQWRRWLSSVLEGTWPHWPGPQRVLRSHRNEGCHLWSYFPLPVPKGCALLEQPSSSLQHNDEHTAWKLTITSSTHLPEAHKCTCSLSQNTEITDFCQKRSTEKALVLAL